MWLEFISDVQNTLSEKVWVKFEGPLIARGPLLSLIIMIGMLAISCLVVLPAVLANDPLCRRCCNLESTVVESTLALVQCDKDGADCPEKQRIVDDYLPEYMRCLTKSKGRAAVTEDDPSCENYCVAGQCSVTCQRDGKGLQWIISMLPEGVASALGMGGSNDSDDGSDGSDEESDGSDDDSDGSDEESDESVEEEEEEVEEEEEEAEEEAEEGAEEGAEEEAVEEGGFPTGR